jgi:hypothetical protein
MWSPGCNTHQQSGVFKFGLRFIKVYC